MTDTSTDAITLGIGGLRLRISSAHPELIEHVRLTYAPFIVPEAEGLSVELAWTTAVDAASYLAFPHAHLAHVLKHDGARLRERTPSTRQSLPAAPAPCPDVRTLDRRILLQRHDFACAIDSAPASARALVAPGTEPISVETVLRICCSYLALNSDVLLLHAGGLIRNGHGYLFPGPSDTGKSTIVGMRDPQDHVLSDEMVLVGKRDGTWMASSTPFYGTNQGGKHRTTTRLDAIFFPVQDTQVALRDLPLRQAMQQALISVVSPGGDASMNQAILDLCVDLVTDVPHFTLHFRKDPQFWGAIDALRERTT